MSEILRKYIHDLPPKPKFGNPETIYKGWLTIRRFPSQKDMGIIGHEEVDPNADGVAVLPIIKGKADDGLVLVIQYRHSGRNNGFKGYFLQLVEGGIGGGELQIDAAHRELLEETGYQGKIEPMFVCLPEPAFISSKKYVFRATDMRKTRKPEPEEAKHIKVIEVPYADMMHEILSGSHEDLLLRSALFTDFATRFAFSHPGKHSEILKNSKGY